MRLNTTPYATIIISLLTFLYSSYVAFDINGNFFSNVNIPQLEAYGGLTLAHLKNFELWRIFASQLIHAKYMHMFYNVLSLIALGLFLERYLRSINLFLLWLISGAVGTLVGTLFEVPPWNLGTGASQAVLGIAVFGLVLAVKGIGSSKWLWVVLGVSLIPAFALDLISVGYPKPGHVVSVVIGLFAAYLYLKCGTKSAHKH